MGWPEKILSHLSYVLKKVRDPALLIPGGREFHTDWINWESRGVEIGWGWGCSREKRVDARERTQRQIVGAYRPLTARTLAFLSGATTDFEGFLSEERYMLIGSGNGHIDNRLKTARLEAKR